jgi:hypothetical protein
MRPSRSIAIVATFTALIVGSDFVLSPFANVKLLDTLVFVSAYLFGFRVGALVGVLSETIWSFASPVGIAGPVAPFLIGGEVIFAVAGWAAAKAWGRRVELGSPYAVFIGSAMLICAFLWDLETNFATALFAFHAPTLYQFLWTAFNPLTIPFILAHEGSDFVFGLVLVPAFILLIPRVSKGHL